MAWLHSLFRRRTLQYRPISLVVLVVASTILYSWVVNSPHSLPVHVPSQNETKAIQAAWAKFSGKDDGSPVTGATVTATKLKGMGWIVQIECSDREIESYSLNTYYVGPDFRCELICVVAH